MFRWLTDQYPNIIKDRLDEGLSEDIAVDNFYLDMNGIIHPCTHGNAEGEFIYLDETAMFKKIFLYVDRLYKMVQPSKVMYLAVDGVAPRAKMNQQRSRRFRSAKEAETLAAELLARDEFQGKESSMDPDRTRFDSNCITPGTDFMLKLSLAMQKWVDYKMKTDPFWMNGARVIVSGPDVPGEGEHKVMEFIREEQEKHKKGEKSDLYGTGWTHVLYGLDADLIMLGLVTHEPRFALLREKMSVVMAGRGRNKYRKKKDMMEYNRYDFELLELNSLRQLLAIQFRKFSDKIADYSLDRIVDDFVFMCMLGTYETNLSILICLLRITIGDVVIVYKLQNSPTSSLPSLQFFLLMIVGNDFLPHSPHLEIDSGALSLMLTNYIDLLPDWGGYLTDREKIHPQRFEQFIYHLALYESEHFKRRGFEENEPGWKLSADNEEDDLDFYGQYFSGKPTPDCAFPAKAKGSQPPLSKLKPKAQSDADDDEAAAEEATPMADDGKDDDIAGPLGNRGFRRRYPDSQARSYRDFYYETKMGWPVQDRERTLFQRRAHVRDYMEGLHWNLNYYHNGCVAWDWYFPHLYSPLSTDMVNLGEFYDEYEENKDQEFKAFPFEMGTPVPSLAQLLSVLPPQSAVLLPKPLGELMLHPSSPLIQYYPPDFTSDANGKRQSWEAIAQIPFIESGILLDTVTRILDKGDELMTPSERRRNVPGSIHKFEPPGGGEQPKSAGGAKSGRIPKGSGGAGAPKQRRPSPKGSSGAPKQRRSPSPKGRTSKPTINAEEGR
jgi:5'-3' exoribonuclease 1